MSTAASQMTPGPASCASAAFEGPPTVYINLDHRVDRRAAIEAQCSRVGLQAQRFPAVAMTPGSLGCTLSHISVLKLAKAQGWDQVLVLEDDFCFVQDPATVQAKLARAMAVPYDVICLAYVHLEGNGSEPVTDDLAHTWFLQTTSGYLVHSRFYDTLLANFQEGLMGLMRTGDGPTYALDRYWFKLQKDNRFLCFSPRLGKQTPSFSDIERRSVDYSHLEPV